MLTLTAFFARKSVNRPAVEPFFIPSPVLGIRYAWGSLEVESLMGNSCSHLSISPQLLSHRFMGALAFFIFRKVKPCKSFRSQRPMSVTLFPVRSSLAWGNSTDTKKFPHRLVASTQCGNLSRATVTHISFLRRMPLGYGANIVIIFNFH